MADAAHSDPVIEALGVSRVYGGKKGLLGGTKPVRAVEDVSLVVNRGETLGIVGESGSGKSTLGELLLGLAPAAGGEVRFCGAPLPKPGSAAWRRARADMQLIYQDPLAALDPRLPIGMQIAEPLRIHRIGTPESRSVRVEELAQAVGLSPALLERPPGGLSGGQRQRAVIARAMATSPKLIVCDEPVSALDVSIQAQVVNSFRPAAARQRRGDGLHQPRSQGRAQHRKARRGDVSRPYRRGSACG